MWLLKVIDFIESIPSNVRFVFGLAWLFMTWPLYWLWYYWQSYRAHRALMRYLSSKKHSSYYREDV